MQERNRIPRWIVENDPSWEKSIDSNLGMLKWTKKASGITAVASPTSMFCDILGLDDSPAGLADVLGNISKMHRQPVGGMGDISKYLASRHLNPGINGPRFDLKRFRSQ